MVHLPPPPPPPPPCPLAACPRTYQAYLWESKMINTCYFKGTHFVCTTCHYNTKRIVLRLTCILFKAFPCLYIIIYCRAGSKANNHVSMNFGVCMHVLYILLMILLMQSQNYGMRNARVDAHACLASREAICISKHHNASSFTVRR